MTKKTYIYPMTEVMQVNTERLMGLPDQSGKSGPGMPPRMAPDPSKSAPAF